MSYYEIADKRGVLETSEPIYGSADEAKMAGYRRVKERHDYLIGEIPRTGGKVEGGLRSIAVLGPVITTKSDSQRKLTSLASHLPGHMQEQLPISLARAAQQSTEFSE